jgi:sortase (surface protein transpeptidase)
MVKITTRTKRIVLAGFVLLFLVITGVFLYRKTFDNKDKIQDDEVIENQEIDVVTESVEVPSEEEPEEFYVPPDLPKYITIPSIGVRGYIQSVSIDQKGLIAVPTNVHLAGWYVNSAKPGKQGLSIIDGHRDGSTIGGIFRKLEILSKGDNILIEYGDGSEYRFEVVDIERLSIEDAFDFMYSKIDDVNVKLNLVTCGGRWSKELDTYEDRIVVRAKGI